MMASKRARAAAVTVIFASFFTPTIWVAHPQTGTLLHGQNTRGDSQPKTGQSVGRRQALIHIDPTRLASVASVTALCRRRLCVTVRAEQREIIGLLVTCVTVAVFKLQWNLSAHPLRVSAALAAMAALLDQMPLQHLSVGDVARLDTLDHQGCALSGL